MSNSDWAVALTFVVLILSVTSCVVISPQTGISDYRFCLSKCDSGGWNNDIRDMACFAECNKLVSCIGDEKK